MEYNDMICNCPSCGKYMAKKGTWDEFPDGPYINTEWTCVCGTQRITSDDFRLRRSY